MRSTQVTIVPAISAQDVVEARRLFEEYAASLTIDLCFQGFAKELAELPGTYALPRGRLLLAKVDGVTAGCVALRPHHENKCELKRLFVRPALQARGLGRVLLEHAISAAHDLGYAAVLLDTLPSMQRAIRLYTSFGFVRRPPYFESSLTETIFMELTFPHSNP